MPEVAEKTKVLVVDDDPTVADVVVRYLEREGFAATWVADGNEALDRADKEMPDLMVLDIMLPGIDGLEVCRRLRAKAPIPVIMLTALGEENDRVMGLELGADDYMMKPFSPRELIARIRAVLRRAQGPLVTGEAPRGPIEFDDLRLDLAAREVTVHGEAATLTALEFDLLAHFATHPRRTYTREELLEKVWGYTFGDSSTVTVHVRRLREKVESDPTSPSHIVTVWGVGYRFDP